MSADLMSEVEFETVMYWCLQFLVEHIETRLENLREESGMEFAGTDSLLFDMRERKLKAALRMGLIQEPQGPPPELPDAECAVEYAQRWLEQKSAELTATTARVFPEIVAYVQSHPEFATGGDVPEIDLPVPDDENGEEYNRGLRTVLHAEMEVRWLKTWIARRDLEWT